MSRPLASSEPLVCPSCARTFPLDERFCPDCKMPLVYAGVTGVDRAITDVGEKARKIKPQYSEGDLVRVAGALNQAEAEFIQGMLLEAELVPEREASAGPAPARLALALLGLVVLIAIVAWVGTEVIS